MTVSLLGRIARHGVSGLRNAREDRLTELWAAMFEADMQYPGFARHIALAWLNEAASSDSSSLKTYGRMRAFLEKTDRPEVSVETQLQLVVDGERRRPDLAVTFFDGNESATFWLEIKHGTGPHTQQIRAYQQGQNDRQIRDAAVMLLAPRADYRWFKPDEMPMDVPRLTWEATGRAVRSFRSTLSSPVGEYLLDELLRYMEEEGLMDPEKLTAEHLIALAAFSEARAAIERIGDLAADRRGETERGSWPRHEPRQFWWRYTPAPDADRLGDSWWWDWKLLFDARELFPKEPGRPVIVAGVTGAAGALATLDEPLRVALLSCGSALPDLSGSANGNYVIGDYQFVTTEFLSGTDLESQSEQLEVWLTDVFDRIEACVRSVYP